MATDDVRFEVVGRVARVTMNRPQYRNAQSAQLLDALDGAFAQAAADDDIRVIVLAGEGEAFSAGHDLGTPDQVEALARQAARGLTEVEYHFDYSWDRFLQLSLRWRDLPKPTIAAVHGWCIFGGWLVASAMDLIVAADDARFMTALLQYFPLPFDVGPRKAKELLFDNRVIAADEALTMGFVNQVVPRTDLDSHTMELATRIAESPSFYLRMAKLAVNASQDAMGFHAAVQGAHSHYMLGQLQGAQWRRDQIRQGKAEAPTGPVRKNPAVTKVINRD